MVPVSALATCCSEGEGEGQSVGGREEQPDEPFSLELPRCQEDRLWYKEHKGIRCTEVKREKGEIKRGGSNIWAA